MRPDSRAMILDLDDTLYPLRLFRISGFAAVARHVALTSGVDEEAAFNTLVTASRGPQRGRELDTLIARFDLKACVPSLVRIIRAHEPVLQLPPDSATTLLRLRRSWRLAIVTNGIPTIQAAKVRALGIERLVDTVVFASEHGSGEGKPEREPFLEALRRLDVPASQAIGVGDDEFADVFGGARCGLRIIQTREWRRGPFGPVSLCADAVVDRIADVPAVAECILPRRFDSYAA